VWRAPGRAHGTTSVRTRQQRRQARRRISASNHSFEPARSRCRQRRGRRSYTAQVFHPHGQQSLARRRCSPTTIPAGVKLTEATAAPVRPRILLNAVLTRTCSPSHGLDAFDRTERRSRHVRVAPPSPTPTRPRLAPGPHLTVLTTTSHRGGLKGPLRRPPAALDPAPPPHAPNSPTRTRGVGSVTTTV